MCHIRKVTKENLMRTEIGSLNCQMRNLVKENLVRMQKFGKQLIVHQVW